MRHQRGRRDHLHEPVGGRHAGLVPAWRGHRRRSGPPGQRDPGLPPRARPARHRAAAQRHQLRHPLQAARRFPFPRDPHRVTGRGRGVPDRGGHRLPGHVRAPGVRRATGPARVPGRLDRPGQPEALPGPPRPRPAPGRPDGEPGGGAVLRHRPLQGRERQPGPPGRGRTTAGDRGPPAPCDPGRRHAVPLRRRRVRDPPRGDHVGR